MAKLTRETQEIFCSQGGSQQITAFGTAKNDSPTYTNNISEIQNTNFLYGWTPALLPDKAPFKEDSNALFYLITRQLAYIFQEGMPEYDANTTYGKTSFVKGPNSATIYVSLVDDNKGNSLTNTNYWKLFMSDGSFAQYEIGKPEFTLSNTLLTNEIWLEGQTVSRATFSNLFNIYGTFYGAGDGTTTFKLPDFRNRAIWGSNSFGYIEAGLPNITGTISSTDKDASGSFALGGKRGSVGGGQNIETFFKTFSASLSNPLYGKSPTVQPAAIKVRVKTRYY